nr:hypothetical protein CFP56_30210 [Quercus suber]
MVDRPCSRCDECGNFDIQAKKKEEPTQDLGDLPILQRPIRQHITLRTPLVLMLLTSIRNLGQGSRSPWPRERDPGNYDPWIQLVSNRPPDEIRPSACLVQNSDLKYSRPNCMTSMNTYTMQIEHHDSNIHGTTLRHSLPLRYASFTLHTLMQRTD